MNNSIGKDAPLWERLSFRIEFYIAGIEQGVTPITWLFDYEVTCDRKLRYTDRRCFWPRAWIRVLGVNLGVGFYYLFPETIEP